MSAPVLEARGLVFGYRDGPPVLAGADLVVRRDRRLAVLGPNGGGKTTLFRLLLGLLRPHSGEVLLDGVPLDRSRRGLIRLRESAQLVLQDPDDQLFAADVGQDVSFGPLNLGLDDDEVARRVSGALAAVGASELIDRPTHQLSFGQRKRVAIAGALAVRPRVLVLDEPTAGLDPAGVEELVAVLARLQDDGTAVVLSTHDVDLAYRWADDVAVVAGGRVVSAPAAAALDDAELLAGARLGPAWAPAVARLLAALDRPGPAPRTAAELHDLLAEQLGLRTDAGMREGDAGDRPGAGR
ncbi:MULTISPECIES: energy-coupling factor ABC transporter ATP-binding protein [Pseudonocardia]|uniref:ABC transporter ATP-binding protein n=2 Tax=Pseudonocardia TaxID=1847 RepID=A0A1Y2MV83_PSEAH|nr:MULTISPECIES: ATP-binding cassette domain-containing protein [Pseudonocardia]OSY38899.1 Energy-coupling factor transporter ATP-binding protein EcfA3 [Pseudonocardia autotrophica]TDN76155.1 cobalt/nickel transport system ATP-binding protein [Pseudonocardia autotrophica]BBG00136.1 putative ABC transporter ATP-binding protein [Pseudonocardia autotrophica]GEC26101.1 putative ABC transporter ATP-binding protein [Pseudonocardia saturnea]